ncbi:hypothetical protein JL720_17346 [Aureococcus anophagefferens]|nr:hypothetical protein JL720_17346 [Aureococcus anophagefferens]
MRVACLDGLRPLLIFWRAWIACDCFFLSGFVARWAKAAERRRGRERLTFLWRGIARLAPCYYVSLAWWVLALFLRRQGQELRRYQSDASKYDSVDLRTLHGSGLTLLMLQSWWPVFERDSSAHRATATSGSGPARRRPCPTPSTTAGFASALVGCYAVYAFLAALPEDAGKLAACVAVCCLLRASPAIARVRPPPCAGEAGDNAMTLKLDDIPRHAVDEDGVWECSGGGSRGRPVGPLVNAAPSSPGADLPARGRRPERPPDDALAYACAAAVPAVVYVSPDGSPMERTRSRP